MIKNDPVIKKKGIDLIADVTLTEDQRTAQLKDFVEMKNRQALQDAIGTIKKGQKKPRQPSKAQVISMMKYYCCHVGGWKMSQFKGMNHEQIEGVYYRIKRQDSEFIPMDSEEAVRRFPTLKRKAKGSESHPEKKTKTAEEQKDQSETLTEDQLAGMIIIEEEDFYPDPLQVKHPIIDWEVFTARNFAPTWKITRLNGETSSFIQFSELIKACDIDDLNTLWRLVQDRFNADKLKDMKEMQLWVDLRRLYEPDINDRFWKFESPCVKNSSFYYDAREVHHVSTTDGVDAFMFAEKEYPLRAGTLTAILATGVRTHEDTEKVRTLIRKIHEQCSRAVKNLRRR